MMSDDVMIIIFYYNNHNVIRHHQTSLEISNDSPADTSSQPSAVHGDVSKGSPQNHPGQDRSVNRSKAAGTVIAHGGGASTFGPGGRGHGHGKRGRGPGSGRVTRSGAG